MMQEKLNSVYREVSSRVIQFFSSVRVARIVLLTACAFIIVYALGIMLMRIRLPVQIDVWEGKLLCEAWELANGNPIYGDPAVHGAATVYTPLYQIMLSLILRFAAPSFAWGRLLSLAAAILTGAMIAGVFLKRNAEGMTVGVLVLALFTSVAWPTDWFYSMVRPDAVCHFFWIAGLLVLAEKKTSASVVSALLIAVAFFVKQTALFAVPGAILFLLVSRRRDLGVFLLTLVASYCMIFIVLRYFLGDWMAFYIFGRITSHSKLAMPIAALMKNFFSVSGAPLTLVTCVAAVIWCRHLWSDGLYRIALLSLPFLVGGSCLSASSLGAGPNSMMPACLGMVLLGGFAVRRALSLAGDQRSGLLWFITILLLFQFDAGAPHNFSKSRGKFDGDFVEIVDFLKGRKGTMYSPSDNVITLLAGYHCYDDKALAYELSWHWDSPAPMQRIRARMNSGEYDWLVCKKYEKDIDWLAPESRERYELAGDFDSWVVLRKK